MELIKVNHVITGVKEMLNGLVVSEVINDQDARNLLPIIVSITLKNDTIEVDIT